MFRISKKEEVFFDLFDRAMGNSCRAATLLEELVKNYTNVNEKIKVLEETEHECDKHVHKIMEQLNKSFITPLDREDIYSLGKEIDNITDAIEASAHRFNMFNVTSVREEAVQLVMLIVDSTKALKSAIDELKNMKKSKALMELIIEVNRIENEGDNIFRAAVKNLFTYEKDPIEVIKWIEIYGYLEKTLDDCEEVANIVEGIVMKYA